MFVSKAKYYSTVFCCTVLLTEPSHKLDGESVSTGGCAPWWLIMIIIVIIIIIMMMTIMMMTE